MKTSAESLIDLENLYLISRTSNLDLLHFDDCTNSPLSSQLVHRYKLGFKNLLASSELANAKLNFNRDLIMKELKDFFKDEINHEAAAYKKQNEVLVTK